MARTLQKAVSIVRSKPDILLTAAWTVVISVLLIFALEWFVEVPNRDSSVFIYVAKGILDGEIPYLDRWDHKGPLIYLLNAMGLAVAGMWGVWLLEVVFLAGTVWLAYFVVRDQYGFAAAFFPMAVFAGYFLYLSQSGNHTEQYALLFQFLTLYLFIHIQKGSRGRYERLFLVSVGALAAAAFLLRANLIGLWIAIGIYWVFIHRRHVVKYVLWLVVGAALIILPTAGIFVLVGGLSEFWDAALVYNFSYSDAPLLERLEAIWRVGGTRLSFILLPMVFSWCIGLYYFRSAERKRCEPFEDVLKLSLIALPIEILLVSASAFDYGHYYMTMLPVVVILMGFFTYYLIGLISLPSSLLSAILLLCVALYFVPIGVNRLPFIIEKYTHEDGIMHGKHMRVSGLVRETTQPDDTILVWGAETTLHLLSERDSPTKFFYQYPLALSGYADSRIFDEFTSDIRRGVPALIIDTRNAWLPPLDRAERDNWKIAGDDRYVYSPDRFQPFFDFVEEEYEFMEEIEGYAIYRRQERSPG